MARKRAATPQDCQRGLEPYGQFPVPSGQFPVGGSAAALPACFFRKLRNLAKVAHRGRNGTSCPAVARATATAAFAPCRACALSGAIKP